MESHPLALLLRTSATTSVHSGAWAPLATVLRLGAAERISGTEQRANFLGGARVAELAEGWIRLRLRGHIQIVVQ
jgi:hypothetical protein